MSFALPQPAVTLQEPVFVDFSVENGLPEGIRLDLGLDRKGNIAFTVLRPDGSRFQLPPPEQGSWRAPSEVSVPAGGTYTQRLLLNQWYQFVRPGTYEIEAKLASSIETETGREVHANLSQHLTLRIEPWNAASLAEACRKLANTAVHEPNFEIAANAVLGLAYVQDLVAVPYLGQVAAEAPIVRQFAVEGLGRIAYAKGIGEVISRLNPQNPDLNSEIRAAVRNIQAGSKSMD